MLLVQSDPRLSETWAEALARGGHEVLAVEAIADGIARAREGGLDVVVLDSDGDAAVVRALVAELDRLPDTPPFVLVSASPEAPELSAQIGAAGFLPKPCSPEDLAEVVARVASAAVRHPAFDEETTSPRKKY
ncbi:MAG: response regulator [Candidatus Binatia bacterium]